MPIDPAMLAKSIGTLTDLQPRAGPGRHPATGRARGQAAVRGGRRRGHAGRCRWQAALGQRLGPASPRSWRTTRRCSPPGPALQAFTTGKPAIMHDATLERRWGEITLTFVEVQIRSGLSVPVELGGGPIGTLDVYVADPRGWDPSEVAALQAYAGLVGDLARRRGQGRAHRRPGRPAPDRPGLPGPDRAGQAHLVVGTAPARRSPPPYDLVPVISRSRSNIADTIRQPRPSSDAAARPRGRAPAPSVAWITSNAMSDVTTTAGRLAEQAELLGDADVARSGRDRDADPDRPGRRAAA